MGNCRFRYLKILGIICVLSAWAVAQRTPFGDQDQPKDPGLRGSLPVAGQPIPHGQPLPGLQVNDLKLFIEGLQRAGELESTCDDCATSATGATFPVTGQGELDPIFPQFHTNSNGLGARFNADQCVICHSQPSLGGSAGFLTPNPGEPNPMTPENPLFRLVPQRFGRQNVTPFFEEQFGPAREVRFKFNPDGTRDGGVHNLYIVRGDTTDPTIPNCAITQPDFEAENDKGNLSFRIPLQLFGLGLIDTIQDREILAHHDATAVQRAALGITGHPNRSANDGTITRFGWKAQNKSVQMFVAEAYNVEMGVDNDLFPQAIEEDPNCNGTDKPHPNDSVRIATDDLTGNGFDNPLHVMADWVMFAFFGRFIDVPHPDPHPSFSAQRGQAIFNSIGCSMCHTPAMQTFPNSNDPAL
ncbi:MAG: di-heme oxidoredictase family protein, partial [Blastocatellia bacterium]